MDKNIENVSLPTATALEKEIKREKYKQRYKRVLKSTVYGLIVVAAVAVLIATLVFPVVQIAGNSMSPTLNEGEVVVLVKTKSLKLGDVCAFSFSNKVLIKRIIGTPGDVIDIDAEGNVYVNSELIEEPYVVNKSLGECDVEFPYQVPESQYFMMGDERDTSIDSRSTVIGCITDEQLIGKIFLRIWPFSKFDWLG
ncbi:MAG: signal peptidase I [Clostridia bacterium]|nr:signal peptidase I [Clostridia bacterium]